MTLTGGGGAGAPAENGAEAGAGCCPICHGAGAAAATDPLTGLADRRGFRAALQRQLAQAAPTPGPALLMIDLDRFKLVNDLLGHPAGDALLQAAARRLRSVVRAGDLCARLGGDEFAVLLAPPATPEQATALGMRLVEMLSRPYLIDGQVALVGASIGLALAPADAAEPDALISCADFGLYAAKAAGRGALRRFEPVMRERAEARRSLEQELRAALPLGQLELYYQPQVALAETHLTGFEALLRWRHPGRGIIPPDLFLPLAAEAGLMPSLSAWVLREACLAAMRWPSPLRVAVNVAPIDLEAGALLGQVRRALAGSGLPPHRLELEITETSLLHPTQAVLSQLRELREMGVQISLDDFGTGFSSLTQLRSFPFDRIKLDRSFADDGAVVEAVARLGAALGMRTTAEGVETAEQLLRMREGGCTEAQGYLIGRPVPQAELPALIRHWQEHAAPGTALQRSDAA